MCWVRSGGRAPCGPAAIGVEEKRGWVKWEEEGVLGEGKQMMKMVRSIVIEEE